MTKRYAITVLEQDAGTLYSLPHPLPAMLEPEDFIGRTAQCLMVLLDLATEGVEPAHVRLDLNPYTTPAGVFTWDLPQDSPQRGPQAPCIHLSLSAIQWLQKTHQVTVNAATDWTQATHAHADDTRRVWCSWQGVTLEGFQRRPSTHGQAAGVTVVVSL